MERAAEASAGPPARRRDAGKAMRDAFRQRAVHAIDQIAESATIEVLADALAAATDFGAVARTLRDPAAFPAAVPLDPLADASRVAWPTVRGWLPKRTGFCRRRKLDEFWVASPAKP